MTARRTIALLTFSLAATAALIAVPQAASAHGGMTSPATRTYTCYLEGPEDPDSPACVDAVARGGTQPLYDWFEVNIRDNAGRHREIIPDGQLCGAGREKYAPYNAARTDWPATAIPVGTTSYTFKYGAWVPHPGWFELYITRAGYDPTQPLKWSDLEGPFSTSYDTPIVDGAYQWNATLPAREGRHIIYSIWQRTDSPEAFFNCSDVVFGEDNGGPGEPPPPSCQGSVAITNTWTGGFQAEVTMKNTGTTTVNPWTLTWYMPGATLNSGWNATVTQAGDIVTAKAPSWNLALSPGETWKVGFTANGSSSPPPSAMAVNGTACA